MARRFRGLLLILLGIVMVALQIAWTTRDEALPLPMAPLAVNAVVFVVGLAGLAAAYAGFRMIAGK